jgi:hypothetical protein
VFTLHKIAGSNFGRWSEVTAAPRERGEAHGGAEQTLPASEEPFDDPLGQVAGFSFGTSLYLTATGQPLAVPIGSPADWSLHAGVAAKAHQRQKLERLCRYIALHGCRVLRRLGTIASAAARRSRNSACRSRPMATSAMT